MDISTSNVGNVTSETTSSELEGVEDESKKDDFVKYETHSKLLSQHKKAKSTVSELQQKLQEYEQNEAERERKVLEEQGNYKKMLELERQRAEELNQKYTSLEKNVEEARKLNAFKNALPGQIKKDAYYNFVNTEEIVIDPETGEVDRSSIENVVNNFVQEFPDLIAPKNGNKLPNNAPGQFKPALSVDEWKKLPLKEKRERFNEVINNFNK